MLISFWRNLLSARHRKSPATLLCRYLESLPYIDISTCRHFEVGEEKGANADSTLR